MNLTHQKPYTKPTKNDIILDEEYQEWTRTQPSAINGKFSPGQKQGEERNVYAHVRRAHNSGTAIKPLFSGIPLTVDQHNCQSWYGEAACLNSYKPKGTRSWMRDEAKEWFDNAAAENLKRWKSIE